MRIGIDARFYGSLGKGLGRYTEKLLEHLERLDQTNDYTIFLRKENFAEYTPQNPRFKKVIAQYAWYGLAEQTFFVARLYQGNFDLVHFPHFNVPLLYWRKFIVTIHDLILVHYPTVRNTSRLPLLYRIKFLAYRLVIASAIRRAVHIITVSHFTKNDIEQKYPQARGKVTVTYEAADLFCQWLPPEKEQALLRRLHLLEKSENEITGSAGRDILPVQPYFLYVGNAYPHKNLPVLFAAARAFPTYTLVLVGKEDFFYARLKQEVKEAQISNVLFTGFLTDQELSTLYRFARAYLFPSLYEGFGLPPLEAMARGAVVVSSDRGSLPEILGDAAYFFDPEKKGALVEALVTLERDPALSAALRKKGYDRVAQFRFAQMAETTHALYQSSL